MVRVTLLGFAAGCFVASTSISARAETGKSLAPETSEGRKEEAKEDTSAPLGTAWLVGGFTMLVPFAVGTSILMQSKDSAWQNAGADIGLMGFALAPLAAHLVTGETKRGVLFSLVPAATAVSLSIYQANHPVLVPQGKTGERITFTILYTATVAAGVIGVFDTMFANERKASRVYVVPQPLNAGAGIAVGGTL